MCGSLKQFQLNANRYELLWRLISHPRISGVRPNIIVKAIFNRFSKSGFLFVFIFYLYRLIAASAVCNRWPVQSRFQLDKQDKWMIKIHHITWTFSIPFQCQYEGWKENASKRVQGRPVSLKLLYRFQKSIAHDRNLSRRKMRPEKNPI